MEFQGIEVMCGDRSGGINKDAACSRELLKPGLQTAQATFQIAAAATDVHGSTINQGDEVTDFQLTVAKIVLHTYCMCTW